ncbi:hypothetical protein Q1695_002716 [Nippostrongylus brasiliensis]|nr:hypothetical protein Q1695_002716 [Nippostrongylus brasiliensis]
MPPLLGSISSLTTSSHGAKYDEYFLTKPETKQPFVSRRQVGGMLISIGIIVFLTKMLIWNRPITHYNRESDPQLLKFIYTSSAAQRLPRSGQLFCWVQTSKMYHDTRALAINETWLSRCDHGQLFTGDFFPSNDIPYSTVFAGIPDSYYNLFFKSRYAFFYIYHYISKDFDWYMKADDDTYVIVEHLKEYLSKLDPNKPYYLGYTLKPYLKNGYNAGGAGYVLSKAALKIFNEFLYSNETLCPDDIYEDVGIGRCLANVGIYPHDTRNSRGQNRFNTYTPNDVFHATKNDPAWTFYKEKTGYDAFANDFISFHHLTPDEIRLFDILLYRKQVMLLLALFAVLPMTEAIFFPMMGGGGGGCCCSCGTPQPASCGCQVQKQQIKESFSVSTTSTVSSLCATVEVPAYLVLQATHPAVVVDAAVEAVVEEAVEDVAEETAEAEEDVAEETVEAEEDVAEETVEAEEDVLEQVAEEVAEDAAEEVAEEGAEEGVAEEVVEVEVDVPVPAVEEVVVEEDAKDQAVEEDNLLATQHPQAMDTQRVPVEVHMLIQQVDMLLETLSAALPIILSNSIRSKSTAYQGAGAGYGAAPATNTASSSYSAPLPGPTYSAPSTGSAPPPLPPSDVVHEEVAPAAAPSTASANYAPPSKQLRSPTDILCDEPKIKYVMLRSKKGTGTDDLVEEVEEVDHPTNVEATASPVEAHQIGDEISRNEATGDEESDTKIDTFSDAKCNSKPLHELIIDNIVKDDALGSKRSIHDESLKRFPESTVDVICSGTGFTYLVSTTEHCEAQKDNVICFVYKRPLIR